MAVPKLRFKADDGSDYPEWNDFTKLEDISAFITKGATPTTYGFDWQPNGVYFFRNDCIKNNVFVYGDYSFIAEEANKFLQRSEVTGGDIVIAITGDIGKVGLIPSEVKKANINQHLARVRIVKDAFPYFVYMYLCSDKVQRTYKKIKTGLSMPQLSLAQIRDTNIPVVSLPEQQKIAEFLSTIDTVIAKQRETVFAWEERKKGVMQKLFSQEVRFKADDGSDFPEWEKKKLEDVVEFLDGQRKPLEAGQRVSGKYPYYGASGIIDYVEDYIFDEELILLSEDGANILDRNYRVCFLAKGKYWVNNHAHVLRAMDGNANGFICEQLESFDYRKYNSGGAQPKLNQATCRAIIMNIPCLEEQQKIADCLSSLDEVIEKQKATLAAWEELKKGLLQQMFV